MVRNILNNVVKVTGPNCAGNLDIFIYHYPVSGRNISKIAKNPQRIAVVFILWL
jgi:hypothetical protein